MASCAGVENASSDCMGESAARLEPVEAFVKGMTGQVNANDVARMVALQQHMLSRFEKTNEMLLNFNHLSENRFLSTQMEFKKHIHLLIDTKKDLESVFRRIRLLKDKLRVQYPEAFAACAQVYHVPDDEEDRDTVQQADALSESAETDVDKQLIPNKTDPDIADNCRGPTSVIADPSNNDTDGLNASNLTPIPSERLGDSVSQAEQATSMS